MDAELLAERRERVSLRREKRWSMNSQRLEEIVAELMKPVTGDLRRSFDTDLSALLEEYLTEAGLRALAADDVGDAADDAAPALPLPNFAELALLLQQSACIYGRKVDALHARVLAVCESLHHAASEIEASGSSAAPAAGAAVEGGATAGAAAVGARRGSAAARAAFAWIPLAPGGAAAAARAPARAPPTLPRALPELQPPPDAPLDADAPLHPLHTHYHVVWRLHEGLLVEELETGAAAAAGGAGGDALDELRAALEARVPAEPLRLLPPLSPAPPSPPMSPAPPSLPSPPLSPPLHASSPLPEPPPPPTPPDTTRKRPSGHTSDLTNIDLNIALFKAGAWRASGDPGGDFSAGSGWRRRVVRARCRRLRELRLSLPDVPADFKGFESSAEDIGGFLGFRAAEAALAAAAAARLRAAAEEAELIAAAELAETAASAAPDARELDSDDDGFFEQSSLGDSDASRLDDPAGLAVSQMSLAAEWARRAEVGHVDVRALARRVLRALPAPPAAAPFAAVLRTCARAAGDVPLLLLAALLLANAGNVEVIPGAPLQMNAFQLRLLSDDESRYSAAAADELRGGSGDGAR